MRVKLATRRGGGRPLLFEVADCHLSLYEGSCGEATSAQCCVKTAKLNTQSIESKTKEVRKYYALR